MYAQVYRLTEPGPQLNIPLWMLSASLSGISMLNSWRWVVQLLTAPSYISVYHGTNLLNSHHNFNGVETIQSQVTRKVGFGVELYYGLNIYGTVMCFSKRVNLGVIRNLFAYVSIIAYESIVPHSPCQSPSTGLIFFPLLAPVSNVLGRNKI